MASFWLEFEQGGQVQQASFESDSISIGRDRSSDFVLDHPTVSRQHALIMDAGGGDFRLVVLSRGGLTAVDGEPVQVPEAEIYDGTSLTFGKYTVQFRSHEAVPKPVSGPSPSQSVPGSTPGLANASMGAQSLSNQFGGGAAETAPEPEPPEPKKEDDKGGIMSWDEIAASSEAQDEDEQPEVATDFQRIQKASNKEESNPVLIIGAVVLAAGLLGFALLSSGGDGPQAQDAQASIHEEEPVDLDSVRCHDVASCEQEAEHHYQRGLDLIERRAVETGNLFKGYVRLLTAQAYLEEGGIDEIPSEFDEWQEKHDEARVSLDAQFRDLRMRYHQAEQAGRYREMVRILDEMNAYFPETGDPPRRNSRESQWAFDEERKMKAQGLYRR